MPEPTRRVLVIGWDGADWRILDPLMEAGALPNLAALISRGARAVLTSTIPTHSWSAWPSFLTGVDPVDHGVFDILENRRGSSQKPVSFTSIRERTFLHDLTRAGVETLSINVPLTSPPPAISGKLIGGGVLPTGRTFTHPASLANDLEKAGVPFPINGMSWTTYRHKPVPFLEEALQVTRARQRATEHLMDTTDWRVMVAVFVAPDRVQHCLNEYVSPDHPDYAKRSKEPLAEKVRDVYRLLDEGIGRLAERTGPEDLVIFMSDHGMRACTGTVNVDRLLEHLDLLKFSASNAVFGPMQWGPVRTIARKVYDALGLHGKVSLPQAVNWAKTQAYTSIRSTGEGVNVNLAGREANGIVDPADFARVRDEVSKRLTGFRDPRTGEAPVESVALREVVLKGKYEEEAPDLLLAPRALYMLTHSRHAVEPADWSSGDHRIEGVLAAAGPSVDAAALPDAVHLIDLAPTILAAAEAPASIRATGRVLHELVGHGAVEPAEGAVDLGDAGPAGLEASEVVEIEDHLRGLGYLE